MQTEIQRIYRGKRTVTERRGRLIVFEGLDGTGKTTLSKSFAAAIGAVWTTTPGDDVRAQLRAQADIVFADDPISQQLFYATSVAHESRTIAKMLAQGRDVVVDRYWLSTWVYAQTRTAWLDLAAIENALIPADWTILVELPDGERRQRLQSRGTTAADRLTLNADMAAKLRGLYRLGLKRPVAGKGYTLDASGLNEEAAVEQTSKIIADYSWRLAG